MDSRENDEVLLHVLKNDADGHKFIAEPSEKQASPGRPIRQCRVPRRYLDAPAPIKQNSASGCHQMQGRAEVALRPASSLLVTSEQKYAYEFCGLLTSSNE